LDPLDDNFSLAKSRMFFKQTARDLIPIDDERIQNYDQCIWATLSNSLPTLLSHANNTEDRLWAYLSCASEILFDNSLLDLHSIDNDEINAIKSAHTSSIDDFPLDIATIIRELGNNEPNAYYKIIGNLAIENWSGALESISLVLEIENLQLSNDKGVTEHQLRFYTHLSIIVAKLAKQERQGFDESVFDTLLSNFASLLIKMRLYTLVPFYISQISKKDLAKSRMIDFLKDIEFESEQREVLSQAIEAGFDAADLCREVFECIKKNNPFGLIENNNFDSSISKLLGAWRWLTYCSTETVWDAIIEVNYLLRKLFINQKMAEAVELLSMAPENLEKVAVSCFQEEFPGIVLPEKLSDAQREYECYLLYFEAINTYNKWQKHIEGQKPPELPSRISDENWARMDICHRAEYETSCQRARECLQKYIRLTEMLKKAAVDSLERLLKQSDGWLVTLTSDDENSIDPQLLERANDFRELRKHYFFHVIKLLIDVYSKSNDPMKVLELASVIVDSRYNIHKALTLDLLRQLLAVISTSGSALL